MEQILLIEDSEEYQTLVKACLDQCPVEINCVSSVLDAMRELESKTIDLILLDVTLSGPDGFSLFAQMQTKSRLKSIPTIFLTGSSDLQNKVTAFALGAEDYIVKPFDLIEFQARITAKLRRIRNSRSETSLLVKGDLTFNISGQKVFLSEDGKTRDIQLTATEFKILHFLAIHEGTIITKDQILSEFWGDNIHVVKQSVYTHIYSLRKKLSSRKHYLGSTPREGYQFLVSNGGDQESHEGS